jgi:hypothetical protein
MLKTRGIENPNPRDHFIDDIIMQFKEECQDVHHFFLFAVDANEALGEKEMGINRMCSELGLVDPYLHKHNDFEDFSTHINGSKRIDMILCTPNLLQYISKIGYIKCHETLDSDHRAIFCNISKDIF